MKIFILLLSTLVYSQDYKYCIDNSIIKQSFYKVKNKLIKGISHGDAKFIIEPYFKNNDVIVLKIYIKENSSNKFTIKGVNCNKICNISNDNEAFRIKDNITTSDNDGFLFMSKTLKVNYISINYPGITPIIIDYERLIQCYKRRDPDD